QSCTRKCNTISRHYSTASATMPHMSTQAERPKNVRTRRQPLGFTNDIVRPGKLWPVSVHGFPILPDEQPVGTVRDSLYDLIPFGPREEKLIGTSPFLRLQKVKQLGFVFRVWPGATNTRYEHSLGCYHLAVKALRAFLQRGEDGGLDGSCICSVQVVVVGVLVECD